jgi:1-acyl-sn-glycerol-3-phosphate acyltransferase
MGKYEDKVNYAERILKSSFFIGASIPFFFSIIVIPFFLRNSKTKELSEKHTKKWFEILFNIFNIKLELYGEKNTNLEKFIICSNHISFLDIPAITLAFKEKKIKFFAKEDVLKIPVIGWGLKIQNHPIVKASSPVSSIKDIIRVLGEEKPDILCIFPEGTRGEPGRKPNELLPFREGIGFVVDMLNLPVVPVGIIGTHRVYPPKTIIPKRGKIEVIIGQPLDFSNIEIKDRKEKRKFITTALEKTLKDLIESHMT